MTDQGKRALKAALRIIAAKGAAEFATIDTDIRPYFETAKFRGEGLLEAAITVVVEAIEQS